MRSIKDLSPPVQAALAEAERIMVNDPTGNIHRVQYGQRLVGGKQSGPGIVFCVTTKGGLEIVHYSPRVPKALSGVPTDVQEKPRAEIELLMPGHSDHPQACKGEEHRQCYNTPMPGGIEIQPVGKGWVGTLGMKVIYQDDNGNLRHGAITNWHVATGDLGRRLVQPGGSSEWFASVAFSPGVKFGGSVNYIDIAVLDIERTAGAYAPRTHTVRPEQLTLGPYLDELSKAGLGDRFSRDGRTLGRVDTGKCVGIGVSIMVGYGENRVALFRDQMEFTALGGFSAPGDSGSAIFEYPAMKPAAKLFAGGGGSTFGSPLEYAVNLSRVHSFQ